MEGRGGCCITRHAAAGVYDMSKMHRIMLRFRPIAPKPATGESVSPKGNSTEAYSKTGRGKRRHSKDKNSMNNSTKRCNRRRKILNEERRVTLPLLPEKPDCKNSDSKEEKGAAVGKRTPLWLNFDNFDYQYEDFLGGGLTQAPPAAMDQQSVRVVGSWVTVECVTDTWVSGEGIGSTDEERKFHLSMATFPGFISDGLGRVTWTNGAYKEMIGGETVVWLATKERLPTVKFPAFTCMIKVQQYTCGKETSSLTLPCDVWRMDGGGFAWKLDINAALCLGR